MSYAAVEGFKDDVKIDCHLTYRVNYHQALIVTTIVMFQTSFIYIYIFIFIYCN